MNNKILQFLFIFTGIVTMFTAKAQDTTNAFGFNFNKVKPIVQVFGTASYNVNDNFYSYGFGRAHLGFQYKFNEKWSSKIIIDRGKPTTIGQITVSDSADNLLNVQNSSKEGAYYTMFLKFASLQWKVNEKLKLEGGAILQNHYITQERFWGYRYVAQTFQDRYYHTSSTDLGFIGYYKFNDKFGFDVALTNGEGVRVIQDKFGKVKIAAGFDLKPLKGLQIRIYYANKTSGDSINNKAQQLISVFAGYKHPKYFRVGGEFNYQQNHLNIKDEDLFGYSIFGSYIFSNKFEIFVRFDKLISNTKAGENKHWHFYNDGSAIITGFQYSPVKGVNLSLNYQGWIPDNNDLNFQNHVLLNFEYKF
ncbi:MAG: hypothetical protein ISS18_12140 [Bacteroidales bacterium]|nr:hypothetical protein [Bacteroidales bacterium]